MSAAQELTTQWRAAARALGIEFEGPFTLTTPSGEKYAFAARLPQFGAGRGMLLLANHDARAVAEATALGFGYSCLEPETGTHGQDLSSFIECLRDWGWASLEKRPPWL